MTQHSDNKPRIVFIISPDWTLRTMLRAQLREAGVKAIGVEATNDIGDFLAHDVAPSVIVVDGGELADAGNRKALEDLARLVPVIVVDSATTPAPALAGSEMLRRPVRVQDILSRVLARLRPTTG